MDLQDLSPDDWYLLPPAEDFVAEVDTRRYDTLTFSRSSAQAEDVSLFQRQNNEARSRSTRRRPSWRRAGASTATTRSATTTSWTTTSTCRSLPERQFIQGRTRLAMRVRATSMSTVMLRLAEALQVRSVTSVEYGPLLHLRVRGQDTVLVILPRVVPQDSDLTLIVTYDGTARRRRISTSTRLR